MQNLSRKEYKSQNQCSKEHLKRKDLKDVDRGKHLFTARRISPIIFLLENILIKRLDSGHQFHGQMRQRLNFLVMGAFLLFVEKRSSF